MVVGRSEIREEAWWITEDKKSKAGARAAPAHLRKRKRLHSFLNVAFINAGNDLRSHTLGACSTIGPAGLNFRVRDGNGWIPRGKITDNSRRLAGVNAAAVSGKWEPAAEILSARF